MHLLYRSWIDENKNILCTKNLTYKGIRENNYFELIFQIFIGSKTSENILNSLHNSIDDNFQVYRWEFDKTIEELLKENCNTCFLLGYLNDSIFFKIEIKISQSIIKSLSAYFNSDGILD